MSTRHVHKCVSILVMFPKLKWVYYSDACMKRSPMKKHWILSLLVSLPLTFESVLAVDVDDDDKIRRAIRLPAHRIRTLACHIGAEPQTCPDGLRVQQAACIADILKQMGAHGRIEHYTLIRDGAGIPARPTTVLREGDVLTLSLIGNDA
jgi:hypothetical protein